MSITITGEFPNVYEARQAAQRLRRRGFIVSDPKGTGAPSGDHLLVAYPYGAVGGNTPGNGLMAALPPIAENAVDHKGALVSVLTDDTRSDHAKSLMESLGGRIL